MRVVVAGQDSSGTIFDDLKFDNINNLPPRWVHSRTLPAERRAWCGGARIAKAAFRNPLRDLGELTVIVARPIRRLPWSACTSLSLRCPLRRCS